MCRLIAVMCLVILGAGLAPAFAQTAFAVRCDDMDVDLPAASPIATDFHAHHRYSSGDGARFWSSQSSKTSERNRTRRRSRTTPGSWRRSTIA